MKMFGGNSVVDKLSFWSRKFVKTMENIDVMGNFA